MWRFKGLPLLLLLLLLSMTFCEMSTTLTRTMFPKQLLELDRIQNYKWVIEKGFNVLRAQAEGISKPWQPQRVIEIEFTPSLSTKILSMAWHESESKSNILRFVHSKPGVMLFTLLKDVFSLLNSNAKIATRRIRYGLPMASAWVWAWGWAVWTKYGNKACYPLIYAQ